MRFKLMTACLPMLLLLAGCNDGPSGPGDDETPLTRLAGRDFAQVDRFGLPAVATVFIPAAKRDAYNTAVPANDRATYTGDLVAVLTAFGHPNPNALAAALLPDIQPFNTQSSAGFLNGRKLADDVITAELGLIFGTNAGLNDDNVNGNDKAFGTTFPYLAEPHR